MALLRPSRPGRAAAVLSYLPYSHCWLYGGLAEEVGYSCSKLHKEPDIMTAIEVLVLLVQGWKKKLAVLWMEEGFGGEDDIWRRTSFLPRKRLASPSQRPKGARTTFKQYPPRIDDNNDNRLQGSDFNQKICTFC